MGSDSTGLYIPGYVATIERAMFGYTMMMDSNCLYLCITYVLSSYLIMSMFHELSDQRMRGGAAVTACRVRVRLTPSNPALIDGRELADN